MYHITIDPALNLISIRLSGFWTKESFERFKADNTRAVRSLNASPGRHLVLVDLQNAQLQTQDMVAAAQNYIANAENKARRIALVAATALARMQTKRLTVRPGVLLFDSMDAARQWLLSDEADYCPAMTG